MHPCASGVVVFERLVVGVVVVAGDVGEEGEVFDVVEAAGPHARRESLVVAHAHVHAVLQQQLCATRSDDHVKTGAIARYAIPLLQCNALLLHCKMIATIFFVTWTLFLMILKVKRSWKLENSSMLAKSLGYATTPMQNFALSAWQFHSKLAVNISTNNILLHDLDWGYAYLHGYIHVLRTWHMYIKYRDWPRSFYNYGHCHWVQYAAWHCTC